MKFELGQIVKVKHEGEPALIVGIDSTDPDLPYLGHFLRDPGENYLIVRPEEITADLYVGLKLIDNFENYRNLIWYKDWELEIDRSYKLDLI